MVLAKELLASVVLLPIFLLNSTLGTESRAVANEVKQVEQFKLFSINSEPIKPPNTQNRQHNIDGKALSVPQAAHSPAPQVSEVQTTWCVAKPSTGYERLLANIEFCCQQPGIDCSTIQPGGACPDNIYSRASLVMNLYYKAMNEQPHNCDFQQSGLIISQNPSVGECKYES